MPSNMDASTHSPYEYLNENEIDEELICIICQQPLDFPVSLSPCNHTFCKTCIQIWLNEKHTCPTCRQIITSRHNNSTPSAETPVYVPINTRIVLNQLDRLLVRCLRCHETNIQRCHWISHENNCLKCIISCPAADIKCPWRGSRDTLSRHLRTCKFHEVRPIIEELKNSLRVTQIKQMELQNSIDTLESKLAFLLKLINNGNLITQTSTQSIDLYKYDQTDELNLNYRCICNGCKQIHSK